MSISSAQLTASAPGLKRPSLPWRLKFLLEGWLFCGKLGLAAVERTSHAAASERMARLNVIMSELELATILGKYVDVLNVSLIGQFVRKLFLLIL